MRTILNLLQTDPQKKAHRPNSDEVIEIKPDVNASPVLFIFKTVSEKNIGELSFFRVYSGKVAPGLDLINEATGKSERLAQTYTMNGKDRKEIAEVITGDFAGVVKLKDSHTNNTLCSKTFPAVLEPIKFPGAKYDYGNCFFKKRRRR